MSSCGTSAGYIRHVKRGEAACPECREAHRVYMSDYRVRTDMASDKRYRSARGRALTRLAKLHPEEYRQLYRAELERREEGTGDE